MLGASGGSGFLCLFSVLLFIICFFPSLENFTVSLLVAICFFGVGRSTACFLYAAVITIALPLGSSTISVTVLFCGIYSFSSCNRYFYFLLLLLLLPQTQEYNHEVSSLSKKDKTKFNANNGFEDNGVVLIDRNNIRTEGDYYPEKRESSGGGAHQNNGGSANTDVKRISS